MKAIVWLKQCRNQRNVRGEIVENKRLGNIAIYIYRRTCIYRVRVNPNPISIYIHMDFLVFDRPLHATH